LKQDQIDGIREFLATAASGISIGAGIMICVPVELMSFAGLDNPDQSIAIKIALLAAAISFVARKARLPFGGDKGPTAVLCRGSALNQRPARALERTPICSAVIFAAEPAHQADELRWTPIVRQPEPFSKV